MPLLASCDTGRSALRSPLLPCAACEFWPSWACCWLPCCSEESAPSEDWRPESSAPFLPICCEPPDWRLPFCAFEADCRLSPEGGCIFILLIKFAMASRILSIRLLLSPPPFGDCLLTLEAACLSFCDAPSLEGELSLAFCCDAAAAFSGFSLAGSGSFALCWEGFPPGFVLLASESVLSTLGSSTTFNTESGAASGALAESGLSTLMPIFFISSSIFFWSADFLACATRMDGWKKLSKAIFTSPCCTSSVRVTPYRRPNRLPAAKVRLAVQ